VKKALVIICAMALLVGLSVAANAAWDNWALALKASNQAWGSAAAQLTLASGPAPATDGQGAEDVFYTANTGAQAEIAIPHTDWTGATPKFFKVDKRSNTWPEPKVWDNIALWLGSGFTGTSVRLAWFIPTASAVEMGTVYPVKGLKSFKLEIISDPTGQHAGQVLIDWKYGDGTKSGGSSSAPLGFVEWTGDLSALKMADASAIDPASGIKLRLTVVPEPSSLLMLASGLTGLAGLALRRRRA